MNATATQVVIVSEHGGTRLDLSRPRTLHEVREIVARCVLDRGGDVSNIVVSLPFGSSTAVVNL
jgi:hypothetical protein